MTPPADPHSPRSLDNHTKYDVILDMRCMQDPDYARRGIGRHVSVLLQNVPRDGSVRLIGLIDPALPPLVEEAAKLMDVVVPNAYAAEYALRIGEASGIFVSLSPMTHAPDYAGRLLSNPTLLRAAIVYDFIPRRFPERYLPALTDRLRYAVALRWLAKCDVFIPISRSAADDLRKELGVPEQAIVVSGCPLADMFLSPKKAAGRQKHVLVVGGGDPRKNPEVVIRGHARSAAMQAGRGIPLVVGGNYSASNAEEFQATAKANGGKAELVRVPGHVSDAELLAMYRDALVVISPSRDEGFSLPVIEGMASGVLALGSDIPAHRELLTDPAFRFDPDDDATLATMLDRVMDKDWRLDAMAAQASVWPRFRGEEVARQFWDTLLYPPSRFAAPAIVHGARPRVAVLTPLPPDRSGVADYTAASCADLGQLVDLHFFTGAAHPTPLVGAKSIQALSEFPHISSGFDRVVSVIGNSHFHSKIFDYLQNYGGACIAHDARMLSFYRILLGPDRAMATASKELGRPVSEAEIGNWMSDESKLEALFLGDIAAASSPMMVHSPVTVDFCQQRYGVTPKYLPFSIYRPWRAEELSPGARAAARARMGVGPADVVITSFGFVHTTKAPDACLWALDSLRKWGIPARLHLVGSVNNMPADALGELLALANQLGLRDYVRLWEGFVPEQDYRDHLVGSDAAVQLRTYGLGGLSGALLDCAAAGVPTVANEALTRAVGTPSAYIRSIPDAISPLLLAEALAELLDDGTDPKTGAQREEARRAFSRDRSFAVYARRMCEALGLDIASSQPALSRAL